MLKLDDNEKLITIFRKHLFYFLTQVASLLTLALLPLIILIILKFTSTIDTSLQFIYFFLFVYFIILVILWHIGFILWTDYYLDMWILTDKRLINVEQKGLFSREISSLRLDRIQDIKIEVSGFIQTFMGMGSVHVQTAGAEKEFILHYAKSPGQVKELILYAHNQQVEEIKTVRVKNERVS